MIQDALIWSLAHIFCGALGEPTAKPASVGKLFNSPTDIQYKNHLDSSFLNKNSDEYLIHQGGRMCLNDSEKVRICLLFNIFYGGDSIHFPNNPNQVSGTVEPNRS